MSKTFVIIIRKKSPCHTTHVITYHGLMFDCSTFWVTQSIFSVMLPGLKQIPVAASYVYMVAGMY